MTAPHAQLQPGNADAPETLLRGWAKAYRDSPEHRFPSDPHAEFFPVDMEAAADEIEQLRRDLSHAKACAGVWMNRARKAEAAHECGVHSESADFSHETFVIDNADGSISLDAYAGQSREELKRRCQDLCMALDEWRFTAMFAAIEGGNAIENVREPYRSKIAGMIEALSDEEPAALSPETAKDDLQSAHKRIQELQGENDRLRAGWQPIETAPKDKELLLGWYRTWPEPSWEVAAGLAGSTKGGWLHGQATHWMPQPGPPMSSANCSCGGDADQPASHHDISCSLAISSTNCQCEGK